MNRIRDNKDLAGLALEQRDELSLGTRDNTLLPSIDFRQDALAADGCPPTQFVRGERRLMVAK